MKELTVLRSVEPTGYPQHRADCRACNEADWWPVSAGITGEIVVVFVCALCVAKSGLTSWRGGVSSASPSEWMTAAANR